MDTEEINLQRPMGDNSDDFDVPDTEEGDAVKISQIILQAEVAEVRTGLGDVVLEGLLWQRHDLPYVDIELLIRAEGMPAPKTAKKKRAVRKKLKWEDNSRNIASEEPAYSLNPTTLNSGI